MNRTKIPYVDYTWNPCTGCRHNCPYCFARRYAKRFHKGFAYPVTDVCYQAEPGAVYPTGFAPTYYPDRLHQPTEVKKPCRIFVSDMGDLFGEWVPRHWIGETLWTIRTYAPQHTYLLCTKNPKRYQEFDLPPNVIALTTVEDQDAADSRIPELLQCNARVKGISVEPMLGTITLPQWIRLPAMVRGDWPIGHLAIASAGIHKVYLNRNGARSVTAYNGQSLGIKPHECEDLGIGLDLVICGGMTGPGAVPMHPGWVRSLRDHAKAGGADFYFKGWGQFVPDQQFSENVLLQYQTKVIKDGQVFYKVYSKKIAGRLLDGRTWDEFPEVSA